MNPPQPKPKPEAQTSPKRQPDPPVLDPDFAEEAAPKSSEFSTEKDARAITAGEFDRIP